MFGFFLYCLHSASELRSYVDVIFQTNKVLDTGVAGFIASFRASWYRGAILRTETALAVIQSMARRLRTKTLKSNTGLQVGAFFNTLPQWFDTYPRSNTGWQFTTVKTSRWEKSSLWEVFTVVNCHPALCIFERWKVTVKSEYTKHSFRDWILIFHKN